MKERKKKQPVLVSNDEWLMTNVVHTYKGISLSCKKNEIMKLAHKYIELKIVILSLGNTGPEIKRGMFFFMCTFRYMSLN